MKKIKIPKFIKVFNDTSKQIESLKTTLKFELGRIDDLETDKSYLLSSIDSLKEQIKLKDKSIKDLNNIIAIKDTEIYNRKYMKPGLPEDCYTCDKIDCTQCIYKDEGQK